MSENNVTEIAALAQAAMMVEGGLQSHQAFVRVPEGVRLESLERFRDRPIRIRGQKTLSDVASFMAYVGRFGGRSSLITQKGDSFLAELDFHQDAEAPSWNEHSVTLTLTLNETFAVWKKIDGQVFVQRDFAEFLEMNTLGIVKPCAADVVQIARTLQAKKTVQFESGVRLQNGDTKLVYVEETKAGAGVKGEMEIPETITLSLPVFQGQEPQEIVLKLFYSIDSGTLKFRVRIFDLAKMLRDGRDAVRGTIENALKLKVLIGG
jgi:uncharacterized protein YfdQ (DUF2303 family)